MLLTIGVLSSVLSGVAAVGILTLFAHIIEIVRLWDGHISYRGGRLPWEQHPLPVFFAALAMFWAVTVSLQSRARRTASKHQ